MLGRCRARRMYGDIFYPRILNWRCLLILMSRNTHASYLFTGFAYCFAACRITSLFVKFHLQPHKVIAFKRRKTYCLVFIYIWFQFNYDLWNEKIIKEVVELLSTNFAINIYIYTIIEFILINLNVFLYALHCQQGVGTRNIIFISLKIKKLQKCLCIY